MNLERLISRLLRGIAFFPKTLYLNFKILPFTEACKFPIIVMGRTSVKGINKSNCKITSDKKTGMIKLGAQKTGKRGVPVYDRTRLIISDGGQIIFEGNTSIGDGTVICAKGGKIQLGNDFSCNVNCFIYSQKEITFGDDVLLGWNINFRDNDGHPMFDSNGNHTNPDKAIHIGEHVWIASYVDVIKGVSLASGTIVGTRSLVIKSVILPNTVIAGIPATEIKNGIYWKHD